METAGRVGGKEIGWFSQAHIASVVQLAPVTRGVRGEHRDESWREFSKTTSPSVPIHRLSGQNGSCCSARRSMRAAARLPIK
jgi:hypothetical protein